MPTIGGQNLFVPKGPMDQRQVEKRPDVLVFTSEPLAEPIEVTGRVAAKLSSRPTARTPTSPSSSATSIPTAARCS